VDEPAVVLTDRARALEQLGERRFDLLVVGGGIVGAAVAAEASRAGLAVALVDRGDFGGATSSASSKLVHGGLRYLRLGHVGLVREAHAERRALMRLVAPHLVQRLRFVLPLYEHGPYRPLTVQAGLVAYSALARARLSRLLSPGDARALVPDLKLDGLRACGLYADAWTNDSRLCLANVRAAAEAGATVANYAEVTELHVSAGRVVGGAVVADGESLEVQARVVVNATGPWIDHVRRLEDAAAGTSVRLSKGAHVLLERPRSWSGGVTILQDRVRVSFALPWEGMLLLGTTDTPFDEEPDTVEVTPADVDQILAEAGVALRDEALRPDAVRAVYGGLRVLPAGEGTTADARRETMLSHGRHGMLSVAGGKLTTHRRIALAVLDVLRPQLGLPRLDRVPRPLPGAADPREVEIRLARSHPELPPGVHAHLAHLYGTLAGEVLAPAADDPALLEPLHPDGPDLVAQAVYARTHEWALQPEDVLYRRTTLGLRGLAAAEPAGRP
jgi:glycerol-3-phosphate dehydrogenase